MARNQRVAKFLDWLKKEGALAGKENRSSDQKALAKIEEALAPAMTKDNDLDNSDELMKTLESFARTYEATKLFNKKCQEPNVNMVDVMKSFNKVNQLAQDTDECTSEMKTGSVKAAVGLATLGIVGGAVGGALKYGFKYALEGFQENGGLTIPGVVSGVLGLAVGLIGGLLYGAGVVAAKGWEAGKKWDAGRDVEEKSTAKAFHKASEAFTASREAALQSAVQGNKSTAPAGHMGPLPEDTKGTKTVSDEEPGADADDNLVLRQ